MQYLNLNTYIDKEFKKVKITRTAKAKPNKATMEERYKFYYGIGRLFNTSLNINFLLDTILAKIIDEIQAQAGSFWLYDPEKEVAICSNVQSPGGIVLKGTSISQDNGVKGYCLRNKKPILIEDTSKCSWFTDNFEKKMKLKAKNLLCIPLLHKQGVIGLLELVNGKGDPSFSQNDIELLELLANTAAIALHNSRLFTDSVERDRMKRELEFASFLQSAILPLKKIETPYFEMRASLTQTKEMGGDFYDWRDLGDGKYMFLIADVSGKGNPAAIFMAITRSILWTVSNFFHEPQEICEKTNEFLRKSNRIDMFVTLLILVVDVKNMTLKYVSAGHNSGFLIHRNGEALPLKTRGMPIGVVEKSSYEQKELSIEKNDLICLYTDGITETMNAEEEEFGEKRLEKQLLKHRALPTKELSNKIFDKLAQFSKQTAEDDRCLILIKFLKGTGAEDGSTPMRSFCLKSRNEMNEILTIMDHLEKLAENGGFSPEEISDILIAAEEICVNVIMYGFPSKKGMNFEVEAWVDSDKITIIVRDKGIPFDPTRFFEYPQDFNMRRESDGGYGLLLIKELMDEISYTHDDEKGNITTLIKIKKKNPGKSKEKIL